MRFTIKVFTLVTKVHKKAVLNAFVCGCVWFFSCILFATVNNIQLDPYLPMTLAASHETFAVKKT